MATFRLALRVCAHREASEGGEGIALRALGFHKSQDYREKKRKRGVGDQDKSEDLGFVLTMDQVHRGSLACWQPGRKSSISS
jgi:hypothetical protein